jgi:HPt (histidine-containing phosphotransfer) domain-containing protein
MPEPDLPVVEDADDGVLDPRPIVRMLGNDAALISQFIDIFLTDIPDQIDSLEQALDDGDLLEAEKRAHRIKGASVDVGGQRVHLVALEVEQAAKREDRATCVRKLVEMRKELDRLTSRLKSTRWDRIPS